MKQFPSFKAAVAWLILNDAFHCGVKVGGKRYVAYRVRKAVYRLG